MANAKGKHPRIDELKREIDEVQNTLALGGIALIVVIGLCYHIVRNSSEYNLVIGLFVLGVIILAIIGGIAGTNQIGNKRQEIKKINDALNKKNSSWK